jgi:hypothetical protein
MRHAPAKHTAAEAIAVERANLEETIRNFEAAERREERILALEEERHYNEVKLAHAVAIGPDGKDRLEIPIANPYGHGTYILDRSGSQLRTEAEAAIKAIDAEIERTAIEGVPDPRAENPDTSTGRFAAIEVR